MDKRFQIYKLRLLLTDDIVGCFHHVVNIQPIYVTKNVVSCTLNKEMQIPIMAIVVMIEVVMFIGRVGPIVNVHHTLRYICGHCHAFFTKCKIQVNLAYSPH